MVRGCCVVRGLKSVQFTGLDGAVAGEARLWPKKPWDRAAPLGYHAATPRASLPLTPTGSCPASPDRHWQLQPDTNMTLLCDSWQRAWRALAPSNAPDGTLYAQLIQKYSEPHRHYHTLQHLAECIARFESALGLCSHPGEVEIALWFHDAVYDLQGADNEGQSARWAVQALAEAGVCADAAGRVKNLVLATRHSALPATPDECLLVDIDLAILGAEPGRFEEYERQIRQEYAHVPSPLFCEKRREILAQFLARPRLYATPCFFNALEAKARDNISRSLELLQTQATG